MITVGEWLNNNSGILTFVTCVLSLIAALASWAQVLDARKQYKEENRPIIEIELQYLRRAFYVLRFVNHGKCTAQNVRIQLDSEFVESLEPQYVNILQKEADKSCIIGVGQYHDLIFGDRNYRKCSPKPPAKGSVSYYGNGEHYTCDFEIDLAGYATIFTVNDDQDDLIKKLNDQNRELKGIRSALERLSLHADEEKNNV